MARRSRGRREPLRWHGGQHGLDAPAGNAGSRALGVGSLKTFLTIWLGQLVSLCGSALTSFALGVWMYQQTGSVTQFSLIGVAALLPGLLVSPVAGVYADRYPRRMMMLVSDVVAGLSTLAMALFFLAGWTGLGGILLATSVASMFGALRWPAFSALTAQLVPKEHLGRANGFLQLAMASSQLIAPALGGVLLGTIHISGIVVINALTFVFAVATLLGVRVPRRIDPFRAPERSKEGLWREAFSGWQYIVRRPGLLGLGLFFAWINLTMGMLQVLITPLVLGFSTQEMLGVVLSVGGVGMLAGSVVMGVWGGPKRRVRGVLGPAVGVGFCLLLAALPHSVPLVAVAAFGVLFSFPLIGGSSQTIWQRKVEPALQGRVFACLSLIALSTTPIAYLLAGPLADRIFEPLLMPSGPLAATVGRVMGVGSGRGSGLLIFTLGLALIGVTAATFMNPRIRNVELELPDVESLEN